MGELARGARHDARRVEDAERGDALRGRARVDAPRPRLDARRRRAARLEPPAPRHRVVGLAPQRVEAHLAVVLGALPLVLDDREAGRGLAAPRQALEHDDRRVLLDDAGGGADNSVVRERPRIARDLAAAGARRAVGLLPAWPCDQSVDFKVRLPAQTTLQGSYDGAARTLTIASIMPAARAADVRVLGCANASSVRWL